MQRGVDRAVCFRHPAEFALYLGMLEECANERRCAVHAYVLMTNHVHLLLTPADPDGCSLLMKDVGQRYAQHCNKAWVRTGPFWDGRFKSNLVDTDSYLIACQRYIEMNPVRARMVGHPGAYRWSSYSANAFGVPSTLLSPHTLWRALGRDAVDCRAAYRALFDAPQAPEELRVIRDALHGGLPLGSAAFVERVERLTGRRVRRKARCSNNAAHHDSARRGLTPV